MRRTTGDPAAGGRSPANMDGRGEDDASSFMELGGDDEAPVEDPEEGGDGPGESELGEDDVIDTEAEGDLPGAGVGVMAFLPGAGIGPMGLEALDTSHERMEAAREEGGAHARRCFEVETTVRNSLQSVSPGTAREIARRLLHRQDVLASVQFWLQKALAQALRTCPTVDGAVDHNGATREVQRIWARVLGENADEPSMDLLAACLREELDRREARVRSRSPTRHTPPSAEARPKPSQAPWLKSHTGAEPPCLLPWWERPSGSGASSSGPSGWRTSGPLEPTGSELNGEINMPHPEGVRAVTMVRVK